MDTLRTKALELILTSDPDQKSALTRAVPLDLRIYADQKISEPAGIPGRPALPVLVGHTELKKRSMATPEGRAALIHSLAHIELNAIDLALDVVWRFDGMPDDFYRQWMGVAREEALHFQILRDHLIQLGFSYGQFPAHNALWEMAEKTKHDVLARIALVPRTLEARGLDASPPIRRKLIDAGDHRAGEILSIILRDEIGHVAVGNHWYRYLCKQRNLEEVVTYAQLADKYHAPRLKGPFNMDARKAAGFSDQELQDLARM
ncbi:MAG: ferritin-like domain-containing protein [Polaromonas sp.]|nr:ferritin-like domain-containing protein [Polaromonas sp.]